jgi:phosphopantothenoylcysteine decarboxylase/phosphopantothenate--cysteine ligase
MNSLLNKNILLLVTGSIAAYKSAELVRELVKRGAKVKVGMTSSAQEFITPLTLQALSNNPVATKLLDISQESEINHIKLATETELVIVAPASANTIAKARAGIVDDIVSAVLLATKAPVLFAPAMNINMWNHPATKDNVDILTSRGISFIGPESGDLACGYQGEGRLSSLEAICIRAEKILLNVKIKKQSSLRAIVTAGPTAEPLDPVRFISNHSSGKMGYSLASELIKVGAEVSLISGPTTICAPDGLKTYRKVETAEQMLGCVEQELESINNADQDLVIFMCAAVSDHRPKNFSEEKLKNDKSLGYQLEMVPNPDILSILGKQKSSLSNRVKSLKIVGFAAETGERANLCEKAKLKLEQKKCDYIVANLAQDSFEKDTNSVLVLDKLGNTREYNGHKSKIAAELVDLVLKN